MVVEMNLKKRLRGAKSALSTKTGKGLLAVTAVASLAWMGYSTAPIVKIGAHSTTYTYGDIREVYSFGNHLLDIGKQDATKAKKARNYDSIFQSLMVAGIEKEILDARKVPGVDKERATAAVIASSPYAGELEKERAKLGDDRFYKLFVSPVVSDKTFAAYYMAKDGNRAVAEAALKAAQDGGLEAAAAKAGAQVTRSSIPVTPDTAALAAEAKKSIGALYPHLVEDATGYAVIKPSEVTDTAVVADVVFIPRQSVADFIQNELKDAKVPVKDHFYSWFRVEDLSKNGGVLASVKADKKDAAKEGAK